MSKILMAGFVERITLPPSRLLLLRMTWWRMPKGALTDHFTTFRFWLPLETITQLNGVQKKSLFLPIVLTAINSTEINFFRRWQVVK